MIVRSYKLSLPLSRDGNGGDNTFMNKPIFEKNLPLLLAYLKAIPTLKNKIYTISNKEQSVIINKKLITLPKRSANNGLAQFSILAMIGENDQHYTPVALNTRFESNVFNNKLSIVCTKIENIKKSDLLTFGDDRSFYVSEANEYGEHEWLTDKKYYELSAIEGEYGKYVCYEYDIMKLISDKKIKCLEYCKIDNKVIAFTGPYLTDNKETKREYFEYDDYIDTVNQLKKLFVQNDPRQAAVIYYGYLGSRYTNLHNTIPGLAAELSKITGQNEVIIRRKLYRHKRQTVETGFASPACFQLTKEQVDHLVNSLIIESDSITPDYKLYIFLSHQKDYDIIKGKKTLKTENMKEYQKNYQKDYQKDYQKVYKWVKRNPGRNDFPKKWSEKQIEIANKMVETTK